MGNGTFSTDKVNFWKGHVKYMFHSFSTNFPRDKWCSTTSPPNKTGDIAVYGWDLSRDVDNYEDSKTM